METLSSYKKEIVDALNTALAGERYGRKAFEEYAKKTSGDELRSLLYEMIKNKDHEQGVGDRV